MAACAELLPNAPLAPGQIVGGRYQVGRVLGEGGMGVVVEAMHLGLEVPVALKIIRSDLKHDDEFVHRFVNEARTAALLKGEHIARVYDVGRLETGEPYLVMERLEGISLETFLASNGALEPPEAVRVVLEVCEGLSEAHALSLVHRDIKPGNLFLSRHPDGRSIVKILDFGIAKRLADQRRRGLTNPARSLGSPWYMSPEQMMDPSRVDARTDIWSLGVLLFELLTNDHPFDGQGIPEVCAHVLNARAPSVAEFRDGIDPELDAVIQRCLDKNPARRFPTVQALAASLSEFAPDARSSMSTTLIPRSTRRRRSARPSFGSLAPLADKLRLGHPSWPGMLLGAGAFTLAGAVTWAAFTQRFDRESVVAARSTLERLEFPFDPRLGEAPGELPLATLATRAPLPVVAPLPFDVAETPERATAPAAGESAEPELTPREIKNRAVRYERWLRSQGLVRVEDATTEVSNPY